MRDVDHYITTTRSILQRDLFAPVTPVHPPRIVAMESSSYFIGRLGRGGGRDSPEVDEVLRFRRTVRAADRKRATRGYKLNLRGCAGEGERRRGRSRVSATRKGELARPLNP